MRTVKSVLPCCIALLVAMTVGVQTAEAFEKYSANRDATNCRLCHGDFRADLYISPTDGEVWFEFYTEADETEPDEEPGLHEIHRHIMLDEDSVVSKCDTCHLGRPRFPVYLNQSLSTYLDQIGCMGCHGRYEDAGNDDTSEGLGAGLRQHHTNAGIALCVDCHADADPANYTPVGEHTLPPYYFTPDEVFVNKPTDPCNAFGEEDYAGGWTGLDNDGDGVYDVLDPDCTPPFGKLAICHLPPGRPDKAKTIVVNAASLTTHLEHQDVARPCEELFTGADMIRGGRMYDRFWSEAGWEPTTDHPLWATRPDMTSNPRTGATTWRCKECHGWDYKGVDGAYSTGSHRTGFAGIFGTTLAPGEIVGLLADPTGHDYRSQGLTYGDLWDLAKFVVNGQIDTADILLGDQFTGNPVAGASAFNDGVGGGPGCAACHGVDGRRSPPTTGTDPFDEFPQVLANDNPWEFQHKVRYGHPGSAMRGILPFGGTTQETNDIGAHSQNLP